MHVGIIPDGNRRFMKKKQIESLQDSYDMGIGKFHQFLEWCIDLGVDEVTLYALSLENMQNRSPAEVTTLLNLFSEHAIESLDDERIHRNKIKVNFCGDRRYLPSFGNPVGKRVVANIEKLEKKTSGYEKLKLNVALAYGGRQEILHAAQEAVDAGEELTEENLQKHLWVKDYPDVVIRTAESRLSNFLVWQAAYSELYFVDKLWQELEKEDLKNILADYGGRERRFGR
jgi:undecaprenyl diphosphate synthase